MAWAAVGVAVVGAVASYSGSQAAAGAAEDANNRNISYQQQYNQQVDPFSTGGNREQYVSQLNDLMRGGMSGISNDPMYKQLEAQGMEATQRAMAARGQGIGTNDILALNKSSTSTMMDYFNQQYTRLADLSGASRGGSKTVEGMDSKTAGQMAYAPYQAVGEGIGAIYGAYQGAQQPAGSGG